MKEKMFIPGDLETIKRYVKFTFGKDSLRSGEKETLLAEGKIEALVGEGRTPILIGRMGWMEEELKKVVMHPLYEVPPVGFDARDIKDVFGTNGTHVFTNRIGVRKIGDIFPVTEDEAGQIEERIKAEKLRLGLQAKNNIS